MRYILSLILANLLFFQPAFAVLYNSDKALIWNKNLLTNGGFESGTSSWTASAGTFATTTTSPMIGSVHATWDAAASGNTLTSTAVAIPVGMYGRNAVASCLITTASGTATHTIQAYDGSNILSSVTITSSTTPARSSANFIMPSSGNISVRIYANADEPSIAIDDCYVGPSEGYNTNSVSQATFVGSAYIATTAACNPTRTNTALGAFGTDADCPGPTVVSNPGPGTIQTTDADLPQFTVNNLPPGQYRVVMRAGFTQSAGVGCNAAISDGTTTSQANQFDGTTTTKPGVTIEGEFTYTSAGNRTFQLYGACSSGSLTVQNNAELETTNFAIYRYPLSSEQAYTPDLMAMSGMFTFDSDCSWSRTNVAIGDYTADASCTLLSTYNRNLGSVTIAGGGSALPGVVWTPRKSGAYEVCWASVATLSSSGAIASQHLTDGTTVYSRYEAHSSGATRYVNGFNCSITNFNSGTSYTLKMQGAASAGSISLAGASAASGPTTYITIKNVDQSLPAPVLTNTITQLSGAQMRLHAASVADGAATTTVTEGSGDWINGSCTNGSAGTYVCTINSGVFTATPNCWANYNSSVAAENICHTNSASSTSVSVKCADDAVGTDSDFNLFCYGQ